MRIYLIRHGQTEMNAIHRIDSYRPGASLTELGRRQAAELVERFDGIDIEGIHVSTLVRTRETASPLARARGLEPVEHAGLREIEAGSLEGGTDEASYREYFSTLERWLRGSLDEPMGGGVSGAEVLARYDSAIEDIERTRARSVAIVSHGGVIGLWAGARAAGLTIELVTSRYLTNTQMCVLEGDLATGYRALSWFGEPVGQGRAYAPSPS